MDETPILPVLDRENPVFEALDGETPVLEVLDRFEVIEVLDSDALEVSDAAE